MKLVFSKALLGAAISLMLSSPLAAADLQHFFDLAQKNDAELQAAEAEFRAAQQSVPQAQSLFKPQVNATGGLNYSFQSQETTAGHSSDDFYAASLGLSASYSLLNKGFESQLSQAEIGVAQAEANVQAQRQALILRVAEAYFDLLSAQDNVTFAQAEKKAIARQLDQAQKRFDVGLIAITDVKESQAQYDLAVASEIAAVNEVDIAREALQVIIGEYPEVIATLNKAMPLTTPEPNDMQVWVEKGAENNLAYLAAKLAVQNAQENINLQRTAYEPTVDLSASLGISDTDSESSFEAQANDLTVGVSAVIPLYTGGRIESSIDQAQESFYQAQHSQELQKRNTERQVRASFLNVTANMSRIKALEQALASTQTAAEATEAGFEVGTRTAVDVLLALRETYSAERDLARARYDYILSGLSLKQAAGTLSEQDIASVNRWVQ